MIRISAGTASVLGLKKTKLKEYPTTGYIMMEGPCENSCWYCSQGNHSEKYYGEKGDIEDNYKLSRVTWPKYDLDVLIKEIKKGGERGLKRVCLQEVKRKTSSYNDNYKAKTLEVIKKITENTSLPLSISSTVSNPAEVDRLFDSGVDKVGISLDVCNPQKYDLYKGGSFKERLHFIGEAAKKYPGDISTHVIVGLGESDYELLFTIAYLLKSKVEVGLFAFTPLKNTPLAHMSPPSLVRYRKIQSIYSLLKYNYISFDRLNFDFEKGENAGAIKGIRISKKRFKSILNSKRVFETTGCPDCNRPFYNESPKDTPYNYPRALTEEEKSEALNLVIDNLNFFCAFDKEEGERKDEKLAFDY